MKNSCGEKRSRFYLLGVSLLLIMQPCIVVAQMPLESTQAGMPGVSVPEQKVQAPVTSVAVKRQVSQPAAPQQAQHVPVARVSEVTSTQPQKEDFQVMMKAKKAVSAAGEALKAVQGKMSVALGAAKRAIIQKGVEVQTAYKEILAKLAELRRGEEPEQSDEGEEIEESNE